VQGRGLAAGPAAAQLSAIKAPLRPGETPPGEEQLDYEALLTGMQTGAPGDPDDNAHGWLSGTFGVCQSGAFLFWELPPWQTSWNLPFCEPIGLCLMSKNLFYERPSAEQSANIVSQRQSELFRRNQQNLQNLTPGERNFVVGAAAGAISAAGLPFGGPVGSIVLGVTNTANQTWQDGLERGLDTKQNAIRTATQSTIELVGELAGFGSMKTLLKICLGTQCLRKKCLRGQQARSKRWIRENY
jgi:hypothetical protein